MKKSICLLAGCLLVACTPYTRLSSNKNFKIQCAKPELLVDVSSTNCMDIEKDYRLKVLKYVFATPKTQEEQKAFLQEEFSETISAKCLKENGCTFKEITCPNSNVSAKVLKTNYLLDYDFLLFIPSRNGKTAAVVGDRGFMPYDPQEIFPNLCSMTAEQFPGPETSEEMDFK